MSYINRLQAVLADEYNAWQVGGSKNWDPSDLYNEAKAAVSYIQTITLLREFVGVTDYESAYEDMMRGVTWDVPEDHKADCVVACLDELFEELMGDSV